MNELLRDKRYYHGILKLIEEEHGILPARFDEEQVGIYAAESISIKWRALCTAGVSFEMRTDAKRINLEMYVTCLSRNRANTMITVDDAALPLYELPIEEPGLIQVTAELDGKIHDVKIYLPCLVAVNMTELKLEGATQTEPLAKSEKLYLAFGDSITQGMECVDPTCIYTTQVARNLGMEQLNLGVGGGVYQAEIIKDVDIHPAFITVAYGTNDRLRSPGEDAFMREINRFFDRIDELYPYAKVAVITPIGCRIEGEKGTFTDPAGIREIIRRETKKRSRYALIEGVSLLPGTEQYLEDTFHPNDEGFRRYSSTLLRELRGILT